MKKESLLLLLTLTSCHQGVAPILRDPANDFAARVRGMEVNSLPADLTLAKPRLNFVVGASPNDEALTLRHPVRDYTGPLSVGDPGAGSSLWRESRGVGNDLFHDYRAWKPLDLITIVINETAQGNKQANTRVTNSSSIEAAINNLIGIEDTITRTNKQIDNGTMISAETEKEFTGQGQTIRQDMLKATISAIVMEVLPSGLLRVEGEKIVTVNGEEQNMKISGLVRTRDINSNNEVLSSKIANARVDYYGRGTLGDSQTPGWLYQILNFVWPF